MRICIYCSSSNQIAPIFFEETKKLAHIFLEHNIEVVFGGGSSGLMGAIADVYCEAGGKIQGVMPTFMREIEWAHKGVSDFIFTEDMRERKELLIKDTDAVVTLAGGTGTLEELMEVITLKRLGKYLKPIVILNTSGFYDDLKQLFEKMIKEKFVHEAHRDMWVFVDRPDQVLDAINQAKTWSEDCIHDAVVR